MCDTGSELQPYLPSQHALLQTVQAFYIDTDTELVRWVSTHLEYSAEAVAALANSVADYRGLLKAKRAALLEKVAAATAGGGM